MYISLSGGLAKAIEMSAIEQPPLDEEENIYLDMSGFRTIYKNIYPQEEVISPNYVDEEKEELAFQNNNRVIQCVHCKQRERDVKVAFGILLLLTIFIIAFLVGWLVWTLLSIF